MFHSSFIDDSMNMHASTNHVHTVHTVYTVYTVWALNEAGILRPALHRTRHGKISGKIVKKEKEEKRKKIGAPPIADREGLARLMPKIVRDTTLMHLMRFVDLINLLSKHSPEPL